MLYSDITRENKADVYEELVARYGNACGICGNSNGVSERGTPVKLCIDHDHKTDEVRGLLCSSCNYGIAGCGDSMEGIELALRYFARHHKIDDVYVTPDW